MDTRHSVKTVVVNDKQVTIESTEEVNGLGRNTSGVLPTTSVASSEALVSVTLAILLINKDTSTT